MRVWIQASRDERFQSVIEITPLLAYYETGQGFRLRSLTGGSDDSLVPRQVRAFSHFS
jgi:hypothetical protein